MTDDIASNEYFTRELSSLARDSVRRDLLCAKLEAEVIASRELVKRAEERAKELERLVGEYRAACGWVRRWPMNADEKFDARDKLTCARAALFAAVPESTP